jgi:hypothetical protein
MTLRKIVVIAIIVHQSSLFAMQPEWQKSVLSKGLGLLGVGTKQYKNAALAEAYKEIHERALDVSTEHVAAVAGTPEDVAQSFEEEFLTAPDEGTPLSEKRTAREMELIRRAFQSKNVSGLTLETNNFVGTIAGDFKNKEKSLQEEKNGLWRSKVVAGTAVLVGVGMLYFIPTASRIGGEKAGRMMLLAGGSTIVGGSTGFYFTWGKQEKLELHAVQTRKMGNLWQDTFKPK